MNLTETGQTLSLIQTCGTIESQLQAKLNVSRWGRGGKVDSQIHSSKRCYYLQHLRFRVGGQEGSLNYYYYSQVLAPLRDDLCRERAMAFSQSDVDPAAQIN